MAHFVTSSCSEESLGSESGEVYLRDSPKKVSTGRAQRIRKLPAKFREDYIPSTSKDEERLQKTITVEVWLRCSQTNRKIEAKVGDLSKEDMGALSEKDLVKGSSLIADIDGTSYPVNFIEFTDKSASKGKTGERVPLKPKENSKKRSVLEMAKKELDTQNNGPPPKVQKTMAGVSETENMDPEKKCKAPGDTKGPSLYQNTDRNLLMVIDKKLDTLLDRIMKVEDRLEQAISSGLQQKAASCSGVQVEREEEDSQFIVNGTNLLRLHANNATAYGRKLLDILFTRQELKDSLLFASKKSDKPALEPAKVDLLFECINRHFPGYNRQEVIRNLNQKCRDSGKITKPIVLH